MEVIGKYNPVQGPVSSKADGCAYTLLPVCRRCRVGLADLLAALRGCD